MGHQNESELALNEMKGVLPGEPFRREKGQRQQIDVALFLLKASSLVYNSGEMVSSLVSYEIRPGTCK